MRQIVLDTETTGLEVEQGNRIIEIGCVELVNGKPTGNTLQQYLNPDREVDPGAQAVNGMTLEKISGFPRFADAAEYLLEYLRGAELIIHNAPFDVGFLDAELRRLGDGWGPITDHCTITCTRELAHRELPGIRASLDNLCDHFGINRSHREQHGALLDAQLLTEVYLHMTKSSHINQI